jgi:hypothetical protein
MAHKHPTKATNRPFIKAYFPQPMVTKLKRLAKAKRMSASTYVINLVMDHLNQQNGSTEGK